MRAADRAQSAGAWEYTETGYMTGIQIHDRRRTDTEDTVDALLGKIHRQISRYRDGKCIVMVAADEPMSL